MRKRSDELIVTIPNEVLVNSSLLTAFVAKHCNAVWAGDKAQTLALAEMLMNEDVPEVWRLERIGYDEATDCYVMPHFAILNHGRCVSPNDDGYFDLGCGQYAMPFKRPTAIKPKIGAKPAEIADFLYSTWGPRAGVTLAWTIAAWFVNQIKRQIGFFPILNLYGDTQTGKSSLVKALNRMQGLDEEGLPARKANTNKGEVRKLTQVSGLSMAILEFVPGNSRFDLDQLLTVFNVAPLQVRAQTTNDNRIHEIPFFGALLFCANSQPFTSKAQRERAVSIEFKADQLSPATAEAFRRLDAVPVDELAGFFVQVMAKRQDFETGWLGEYEACKDEMREMDITARLIETHSLLWAFHRIFCRLFQIKHDLKPYLFEIAKIKHRVCATRDETPADFFFGMLDEIKGNEQDIEKFYRVDSKKGRIMVNLNGAAAVIERHRGPQVYFSNIEKLQQSLREHPAFLSCKQVLFGSDENPKDLSTQKRAWIFDLGMLDEGHAEGLADE